MAEEIEIIVTATGFDKVSSGLKNTTDALKTTATEAKKTGDALKSNLNTGAAQAGQSITNLSRIAQDAPFGFIGIANNINPLVESFGRLKAETGSTGGALKALASGLTGPAGLGLAFGVVTAAISFAQIGFTAWSRGAKQAKTDNDEFKKSLESSKTSAISTGLELQAFIDIAKNSTLPLEQRNEALKEANKILGKHGELLTLTNVGTEKATETVRLYTQALIAQSVAAKYADRLAELSIKRTNITNEIAKREIGIARIRAINAKSAVNQTTGQTAGYVQLQAALLDQVNTKQDLNLVDQEYNQTLKDLNNSVYTSTLSFSQLGTKTTESTKKKEKDKKSVETLQDAYRAFFEELVSNERIALAFNEPATKANIQSYTSFIETAIKKFKASGTFTLPFVVELNALQRSLDEVKPKDLVKSLQEKINTTPIDVSFAIPSGAVENLKKQGVDITNELSRALESAITTIGTGIGEGLANVIQGTANFGSIFQGIFQQLGGVVQALGEQIIAVGAAALVAQQAINLALVNPFLTIAAGIALSALGSLIKNTTGPQNRFAVGTRNAPGGMALVGERGPEMISLPRGSQVLPAAQTANMMGGVGSAVEIYGILRGQDIYFSNKKYSATYARTT